MCCEKMSFCECSDEARWRRQSALSPEGKKGVSSQNPMFDDPSASSPGLCHYSTFDQPHAPTLTSLRIPIRNSILLITPIERT